MVRGVNELVQHAALDVAPIGEEGPQLFRGFEDAQIEIEESNEAFLSPERLGGWRVVRRHFASLERSWIHSIILVRPRERISAITLRSQDAIAFPRTRDWSAGNWSCAG
jgi:hypothetical protein